MGTSRNVSAGEIGVVNLEVAWARDAALDDGLTEAGSKVLDLALDLGPKVDGSSAGYVGVDPEGVPTVRSPAGIEDTRLGGENERPLGLLSLPNPGFGLDDRL
jgi:hypothetical protein